MSVRASFAGLACLLVPRSSHRSGFTFDPELAEDELELLFERFFFFFAFLPLLLLRPRLFFFRSRSRELPEEALELR